MFALLAQSETVEESVSTIERTVGYFSQGGVFMVVLLVCSLVSVAIMIWKTRALSTPRVLPVELESSLLKGDIKLSTLKSSYQEDPSVLSRLCRLVEQKPTADLVEAAARRELTRLRSGLNILEVIITIAPLLGLLGTASGLVTVFSDFGGDGDNKAIAKGIAMALSTTIAGLAVAVPSVIAFSYFNRRLETFAARLELVLSQLCLNLK